MECTKSRTTQYDGKEGPRIGTAIFPSSIIYVGSTKNRGLGIFALRDIEAGELIEVCPVLVLNGAQERENLNRTRLFDYYFAWGEHEEKTAIALGYGSLYNHSYRANAVHTNDFVANEIRIYAHRSIRKGEEITINYGGGPDCLDPVWFDVLEE
jgi:SET domain-containing protein